MNFWEGDDLDDLARLDRRLALEDDLLELFGGHLRLELADRRIRGLHTRRDVFRDRLSGQKPAENRVDRIHRLHVRRMRIAVLDARHLGDDHRLTDGIEDDERIGDEERGRRRPLLALQSDARHKRPDDVVGEVADCAALQGRQFGRGFERTVRDILAELGKRIPSRVLLVRRRGVDAEVGIASDRFTAGDGLEQEHRFVIRHTRQHRNGRLAVRQELAEDRRARAACGALHEFFFSQHLQHFVTSFKLSTSQNENGLASFSKRGRFSHPFRAIRKTTGFTSLRKPGATTSCCS